MPQYHHSSEHSCGDYGLTRRALISRAAVLGAGATATTMFGDVLSQAVYGDTSSNPNVLVVLSLKGGADGLSMVVPHAEPDYYAARPTTALAKGSLLHADAQFGLHPALAPLSPMWKAGRMTAIHAVGLPFQNHSHFQAQEQLEDSDPGSSARIGWLNRMIGGLEGTSVLKATALGTPLLPTSLTGPSPAVVVNDFSALKLPYAAKATLVARQRAALKSMYDADNDLKAPGSAALALSDSSQPIRAARTAGPANGATYPAGSAVGEALANAAAMIRTGNGVRAIAIDYGGWDHHVDVKLRMTTQLGELASGIAAFFTDIGAIHSARVTLVTLSEFGRRLKQNGAGGVDHGYGQAVFALGAGVRGGRYYASWPTLAPEEQLGGDLAMTTDYRDVLATILAARFPEVSLSTVFPGFSITRPFDFIRSA